MNSVAFNPGVTANNQVNFGRAKKANAEMPKGKVDPDSFEASHLRGEAELSVEDKQAIIKKAKTKAAGWSTLGNLWTTVYYGFRSDKKVAKKFDLDPEADKDFIKKIKKEQVKATLWGVLGSPFAGFCNWLHHKNKDASKYNVQ